MIAPPTDPRYDRSLRTLPAHPLGYLTSGTRDCIINGGLITSKATLKASACLPR